MPIPPRHHPTPSCRTTQRWSYDDSCSTCIRAERPNHQGNAQDKDEATTPPPLTHNYFILLSPSARPVRPAGFSSAAGSSPPTPTGLRRGTQGAVSARVGRPGYNPQRPWFRGGHLAGVRDGGSTSREVRRTRIGLSICLSGWLAVMGAFRCLFHSVSEATGLAQSRRYQVKFAEMGARMRGALARDFLAVVGSFSPPALFLGWGPSAS